MVSVFAVFKIQRFFRRSVCLIKLVNFNTCFLLACRNSVLIGDSTVYAKYFKCTFDVLNSGFVRVCLDFYKTKIFKLTCVILVCTKMLIGVFDIYRL